MLSAAVRRSVVCSKAALPRRPFAVSSFKQAQAPVKRPEKPEGREWQNPQLGFEPGLLREKSYDKHDHPLRPASAYIEDVPPIVIDSRIAACDGGGGQLGHPKIFINLDKSSVEQPTPCGYCGLRFVQLSKVPKGHPLLELHNPFKE